MSFTPNWAAGLQLISPHYFCGVADDAESILEKHKLETQSCFGNRTSQKKLSLRFEDVQLSRKQ